MGLYCIGAQTIAIELLQVAANNGDCELSGVKYLDPANNNWGDVAVNKSYEDKSQAQLLWGFLRDNLSELLDFIADTEHNSKLESDVDANTGRSRLASIVDLYDGTAGEDGMPVVAEGGEGEGASETKAGEGDAAASPDAAPGASEGGEGKGTDESGAATADGEGGGDSEPGEAEAEPDAQSEAASEPDEASEGDDGPPEIPTMGMKRPTHGPVSGATLAYGGNEWPPLGLPSVGTLTLRVDFAAKKPGKVRVLPVAPPCDLLPCSASLPPCGRTTLTPRHPCAHHSSPTSDTPPPPHRAGTLYGHRARRTPRRASLAWWQWSKSTIWVRIRSATW